MHLQQIFPRVTKRTTRRLIDIDHARVRRHPEKRIRCGIHAEPGLAQILLGLIPLGNITEHQNDTDNLSRRVTDRRCAIGDPIFRTVTGEQYRVIGKTHHLRIGNNHLHRVSHCFTRLGIDDMKHFRQRMPRRVGKGPASQTFRRQVHPRYLPVGIGGDNSITNRMQGNREIFFALGQRPLSREPVAFSF